MVKGVEAIEVLESCGYDVDQVRFIPEGRSHFVYEVSFSDGNVAVAKFERDNKVSNGHKRDFHYNGVLTLDREEGLFNLVRETGLPVPEIYAKHQQAAVPFLLVEKMPGMHWKDYLQQNNFSLNSFLQSMEHLGKDIATVQNVKFDFYGDVVGSNAVAEAKAKFVDRLHYINELKLARAEPFLNSREFAEVKSYLDSEAQKLDVEENPTLVLADFHPMNFFVDNQGKPSGYFDLEHCQSALPPVEIYCLKFVMFNYFDQPTFSKAEDSFFKGFHANGGVYDMERSQGVENIMSVGHLLACVTAYHGANDGLRDDWSARFKEIMFDAMKTNNVDYVGIANVFRSKTGQPMHPSSENNIN